TASHPPGAAGMSRASRAVTDRAGRAGFGERDMGVSGFGNSPIRDSSGTRPATPHRRALFFRFLRIAVGAPRRDNRPSLGGSPMTDSPATARPLVAGRYRLGDEIARGGMGAVFRVRDHNLDRDLAVKVMLADPRDRPDLARRFL